MPIAPVLAFLKMRAWLDRPYEREKDLGDLAYLLARYAEDDDRRWDDEVVALGLTFEDVSPFLLGRDLARIVTRDHLPHVDEFLREASPERIVAHGPPS